MSEKYKDVDDSIVGLVIIMVAVLVAYFVFLLGGAFAAVWGIVNLATTGEPSWGNVLGISWGALIVLAFVLGDRK